jgi:hypothetical protein
MCQIFTKLDAALGISRLTGKNFESSYMELNRIVRPCAFDSLGNFDIKGDMEIWRVVPEFLSQPLLMRSAVLPVEASKIALPKST